MNTKRGLIGTAAGFVSYLLFTYLFIFFTSYSIGNFLFLLPIFSFLAGIGIGYFIKKFKECLIFGGISGIVGIAVVLALNFEHLSNNLLGVMGLNAMGLFFGFGFGGILYYRHTRKIKIINEITRKDHNA